MSLLAKAENSCLALRYNDTIFKMACLGDLEKTRDLKEDVSMFIFTTWAILNQQKLNQTCFNS